MLVDLAHRRFYMFGIEIWPHEFYYVAGLLIMAGIGLFLVTSAVGRAWCGYACPQTVWTDLFQHVERFIDGDRNAQIRLASAPWGPAKIARRAAQICDLAGDRRRDRRRLDLLLRRRADLGPVLRPRHRALVAYATSTTAVSPVHTTVAVPSVSTCHTCAAPSVNGAGVSVPT